VPFTLVDALSQFASQTQQYDIPQLVKALEAGSAALAGTPASVTTAALDGLARFSQILASRQTALATIVTQGSQLAAVLSGHSTQLVDLLGQGDLVLQVLQSRRTAIQQLLTGTTALSQQITSLLSTKRDQLHSLLGSLQTVTAILAKDSSAIGNAIPLLASLSQYAANATGSGRFVDATIPTLLIPDNLIAACGNPANYPSSNPLVGCRP
jgi:phospholipid/cholesterol/gamma-HCH transport system substrate-binding protein